MSTTDTETERLRAQIAELQRQLGEQAARANAAVAAAQERAYWLHRWDLAPTSGGALWLVGGLSTQRGAGPPRGGELSRAWRGPAQKPIRRVRMVKRRLLG